MTLGTQTLSDMPVLPLCSYSSHREVEKRRQGHLFPLQSLLRSHRYHFFFYYLFIYLFLKRGREKEREKNTDVQGKCQSPPTRDLASNPGMCPHWESNWWPFCLWNDAQSTEPLLPGLLVPLLNFIDRNSVTCLHPTARVAGKCLILYSDKPDGRRAEWVLQDDWWSLPHPLVAFIVQSKLHTVAHEVLRHLM